MSCPHCNWPQFIDPGDKETIDLFEGKRHARILKDSVGPLFSLGSLVFLGLKVFSLLPLSWPQAIGVWCVAAVLAFVGWIVLSTRYQNA